ncbi:hypothetical protein CAR_50p110 (plasmid) [Carnobacterium sp. 17-4]|uniref:DUF4127 family protein n=1 Tax=Carnobacterium sp. (strain 17-4) TaxID=208596 RepID=UPI0002058485|nr:DUF4127 family protein [Carnobacterium sp. 17-4]AEB31183.1 hypothetical protein CAR_50p110 [Carnobacterium sp. 17-4]
MKIIYLPLDERPCNTTYPKQASEVASDWTIITPNIRLLGQKKKQGDIKGLRKFLLKESSDADAAVISTEMLAYGGLLPSRLHASDEEIIINYEKTIRQLKSQNENLKLYVSNLIMRTPRSSSSDEEPDYYEEYGAEIFQYGWLKDKKKREGLSNEELQQFSYVKTYVPIEHIQDYENRRKFNLRINQLNISLLNNKIIDFLVIPQDDAAEFGYTAMDQKKVFKWLDEDYSQSVMIYPGADEVGFSLLARAYNEQKKQRPKIFPIYSSTLGPYIIPLYEDRPINETMKAHIMVNGCELVNSPEKADIILAYNTPGKKMQESWDQLTDNIDITYSSYRHLPTFVREIENYLDNGYPVIIADSAYSNGGDGELIKLLDSKKLLEKLSSYKGWNTNGNTLGSTIAAGVFALGEGNSEAIKQNLLMHLFDDFFYQSLVRMEVTENELPKLGLNYFDLGEKKEIVRCIIEEKLEQQKKTFLKQTFSTDSYQISVDFPWNRMFEISCQLSIK